MLTIKRHPDSYHTCYALVGLSTVQHHHYCTESSSKDDLTSVFAWKHSPNLTSNDQGSDMNVFEESDRLVPFHPVFVIPHRAAEDARAWYENHPFEL